MPYPDSDNEEIFMRQYLDAIASADFPAIEEIRKLVFEVLYKSGIPPENPKHWPVHTFILKALDQHAPVNWLTGPPFAEKLAATRQVLDFLEPRSQSGLFQIKDLEGKPIPTLSTLEKPFLRSVADALLAHFPDSEKHLHLALEAIERIEITLDRNAIAEFRVVPKPETVERARTLVKKWAMEMDEQGELRFETQKGNPFGRPVETAQILDSLADLIIEELHALPIHDLSMVDHAHITVSGQKAIGVKLCPSKEAVERMLRERMGKR